jgi:hypothetical protein
MWNLMEQTLDSLLSIEEALLHEKTEQPKVILQKALE